VTSSAAALTAALNCGSRAFVTRADGPESEMFDGTGIALQDLAVAAVAAVAASIAARNDLGVHIEL
jgi:hypothetical protein